MHMWQGEWLSHCKEIQNLRWIKNGKIPFSVPHWSLLIKCVWGQGGGSVAEHEPWHHREQHRQSKCDSEGGVTVLCLDTLTSCPSPPTHTHTQSLGQGGGSMEVWVRKTESDMRKMKFKMNRKNKYTWRCFVNSEILYNHYHNYSLMWSRDSTKYVPCKRSFLGE